MQTFKSIDHSSPATIGDVHVSTDLTPIMGVLERIVAAITQVQLKVNVPELAPQITVNVPEAHEAGTPIFNVESPAVNVTVPESTAPVVNVTFPAWAILVAGLLPALAIVAELLVTNF